MAKWHVNQILPGNIDHLFSHIIFDPVTYLALRLLMQIYLFLQAYFFKISYLKTAKMALFSLQNPKIFRT